jgi:steroid Delta-isomerase
MSEAIERYISALESLRPESVDLLVALVADEVIFLDPFNDTQGKKAFRKVFSDMLLHMEQHEFRVIQKSPSISTKEGSIYFLKWELDAVITKRLGGDWHIEGCSEIHFSSKGLVTVHIDFWDVGRGFYEKIPALGWVIRFIRGRLKS